MKIRNENDYVAYDKLYSCYNIKCPVKIEFLEGDIEKAFEMCLLRCLQCRKYITEEEFLERLREETSKK